MNIQIIPRIWFGPRIRLVGLGPLGWILAQVPSECRQVHSFLWASGSYFVNWELGSPGDSEVSYLPTIQERGQRCGFDPRVRKIHWRREWQPTPVFLPGKIPWTEEPGSCSTCSCRESDMTKVLSIHKLGYGNPVTMGSHTGYLGGEP